MSISNNPPSQIEFCAETVKDIGAWMAENPVIETEDKAKEAKTYVDRSRLALKDLEDERTGKVGPLNDQVRAINGTYRRPREELDIALNLLLERINVYIQAEEERRRIVAEEARRAVEAAEAAAREAERIEREALDDANSGALDSDSVGATIEADRKFKEYEKATRVAARAEKDQSVKIGGGFTRRLSQRTKEELILIDIMAAIKDIGIDENLIEAILTAARVFRRTTGRLPNGVESTKTRKL